MRELMRYTGRVEKLNAPPEVSYVILKEVATGRVVQTDANSQMLIDKGVGQGEEFEIVVMESLEGTISAEVRKTNTTDFNI